MTITVELDGIFEGDPPKHVYDVLDDVTAPVEAEHGTIDFRFGLDEADGRLLDLRN